MSVAWVRVLSLDAAWLLTYLIQTALRRITLIFGFSLVLLVLPEQAKSRLSTASLASEICCLPAIKLPLRFHVSLNTTMITSMLFERRSSSGRKKISRKNWTSTSRPSNYSRLERQRVESRRRLMPAYSWTTKRTTKRTSTKTF
jgi:hypothetical protein